MNRTALDGMSLQMADVYAACVDQLLVNLARHFKFIAEGAPIPKSWEYQVQKLAEMGQVTRESEEIILSMLGGADETLQSLLEASIMEGLKTAEAPLRKAAEKGLLRGGTELHPRQMQAFRMFYAQSADRLNLVNTVMLDSTQKAYTATVADIASKIDNTQAILNTAAGEIVTGVAPFNKVLHDSVRKMVDNGITGFIDHGGHHWSPEAYVAMDMRTTMTNTARESVWEQSESYGVDLYQVSWHNGARPKCYPWQGKVISRNGWTGEVEDDEGNKVVVHSESEIESFQYGGGLFGVNCGHYPIPFIPGFSRIRKPEQNEEQNAKEYAESQQQRALERKLREEKRELAVMKAQGATPEEINAQKIRIKNANTNLDDFCRDTGRARQRARETAPINATFPDGYKQTYYERGVIRRNPNTPTTPTTPNTPATPATTAETNVKTFKSATTRDEAEQYAQERFAERVDYKGISLENANTINETLTELTEKYPINKLDYIEQRPQGSVARANYSLLEINGKKLGKTLDEEQKVFDAIRADNRQRIQEIKDRYAGRNIPPFAQKDINNLGKELKFTRYGVHSSYDNHVKVVITHEYGHIFSDQYFGMSNSNRANPNYDSNWQLRGMYNKWKQAYDRAWDTGDIYKLSKYGSKNPKEFFAECFAAREMGEKLPDYVENLLMEVITNGIM
jgi:hypothetical protein